MSYLYLLCNIELGNKELFSYYLVDIYNKTFLIKETLKRKHGKLDKGIKDEETILDTN